ncbi:MAG: metallophosphoesterase family protein [Balneolaceae bacterium]|nr:metallophosphoesterase family protein [Balneolaceae bacterium]
MPEKKFVAIGDIHGCAESIKALVKKLSDYRDREFVFVGDYIDRGPASKEVVDYLMEFRKEQSCVFIRGNHEQMLLDACNGDKLDLWLMNGGRTTLQSYDTTPNELSIPEEHMAFYENTRLYYDTEDFFFVHAGLSPARTIEQSVQDEANHEDFLWERSHLNAFETPWEKTVVFGHTPRSHPIQKEHMLGIDTGCVYESLGYGKLTAALLPEKKFIQQVCLD